MSAVFITGLQAEAAIAQRMGPAIAGGGLPAGAAAAAGKAVAHGATALVSFGLAGGLAPWVRPGTLIIPEAIWDGAHRYVTDEALSARFGLREGGLLASDCIIATKADKARAFTTSHCLAADMESGAVAAVAAAASIPFAAIRVVCDAADRDLPPAALIALDGEGRLVLPRVAWSVICSPVQIGVLMQLARDAAAARAVLMEVARRVADSPPGARSSAPGPRQGVPPWTVEM